MMTRDDAHSSPNRILADVFGALFIFIGIAGVGVTDGMRFTDPDGARLLAFDVNPLHNVVHLTAGMVWLACGIIGVRAAKAANGVVGAGYLLMTIYGLFVAGSANVLAANLGDTLLHLATGSVTLGIALIADRHIRREPDLREPTSPRPAQHV